MADSRTISGELYDGKGSFTAASAGSASTDVTVIYDRDNPQADVVVALRKAIEVIIESEYN